MKLDEAKTILETVRKTSLFDLTLLSVIILPLLLGVWLNLLNNIIPVTLNQKIYFTLAIIVVYILGLTLMKIGVTKESKKKIAGTRIRNYLIGRNRQSMSFNRIREVIDKDYSDEYLKSVIDQFPKEFRFARIKGGKPGISLLMEEEE